MAPVMVLRAAAGLCAGSARRVAHLSLGDAGAVNLIDHGMTVQEAVEAPRIWTQGRALEVEAGVPDLRFCRRSRARGHRSRGRQCRRWHERDPLRGME